MAVLLGSDGVALGGPAGELTSVGVGTGGSVSGGSVGADVAVGGVAVTVVEGRTVTGALAAALGGTGADDRPGRGGWDE
ncbi:hypothetical protein [Paractinoplanes rishiriensis]|uniref:hypothetical protein n=1 Tax=Paractinoplanes rishiriensis TaxID=1050105 RepID=UPI001944F1C1|nr:hypothetical protein [Actinoplanes rishiriensis]